jgi:hypothetical protein
MIFNHQATCLTSVIVIAALGLMPQSANADIEWTIAPYLWGSDVGLDATLDDDDIIGAEIPIGDLLDKLDMAFMGHFEGRGETFDAFFGAIYLDSSDSSTISFPTGGPIEGDLTIAPKITVGLYELAGLYRVGRPRVGGAEFDILLGLRQVKVDQFFALSFPAPPGGEDSVSINVSETDIFGGARVIGKFSEKWGHLVGADVEGGSTDGTLNFFAAVGYTFGKTGLFTLDLGYC